MSLKSKIILNALFGAVGGFLGWAVTEAVLRDFFAATQHAGPEVMAANRTFGLLVGAFLGTSLGLADGLWSRSSKTLQNSLVAGCLVGAIAGPIGLLFGQAVFSLLSPGEQTRSFGSFVVQVFARAAGWALVGLALGAAQGLPKLSAARAKHGAIGGLVGGFIGGMSFDVAANILRSDVLSRLISLTLTGCAIGFMIGLLQDLLKPAWVVILKDSNEGREIPIYKPVMTIGRDELADIPIFTDRAVLPRHAVIRQENKRHLLEDGGTALGTSVNGQKVSKQILKDRDMIDIGSVRLLFREKATASRYVIQPDVPRAADHPPIPTLSHVCQFCGGIKDANGNCQCTVAAGPVASPTAVMPPQVASTAQTIVSPGPQPVSPAPVPRTARLVAMTGPHASSVFALQLAETSLGREEGRDIFLPNDSAISRRHARIVREDQGFVIYDEGSSNGTLVNGARITHAVLVTGDTITVGATELRFEV